MAVHGTFLASLSEATRATVTLTARSGGETVREDRLVQAVARMHGFAWAGRDIKERVLAAVPDASAITTEGIGRFVWPPGVAPETWETFRAPATSQAANPTEMPLAELVALARRYAAPGLRSRADGDEGRLQPPAAAGNGASAMP